MSNLAPPSPTSTVDVLLRDLRLARRGATALPALDPGTYARDHAAFELLSDQRTLIGDHLAERLAALGDGPVSVLSVGCGDGSLDSRLASGLLRAVPGRAVRYVGVDPWVGSTRLFEAAMAGLGSSDLDSDVHVASFADFTGGSAPGAGSEEFDVVVFVHSMYYVAEVAQTLRAALDRVRPGGELWVLNAPRGALNELVDVLAPPLAGHRQWFSADVEEAFAAAGIPLAEVLTLEALVDLAAATDEVLDFAVQARLTPALRPGVRAYLDAISVPDAQGGARVPHPVVVLRATRPATPGTPVARDGGFRAAVG